MYSENYTGGTLCGATGKDREVKVDYVCGRTGAFLKVRRIEKGCVNDSNRLRISQSQRLASII